MIRKLALALIAAALVVPATADAQTYPTKAVRVLVAAAPGGNPDVLGRVLSQKLSDSLGKPFVIENMPGAGGVVAAEVLAKAAPDGYLIMLGDTGAMAINIAINPKLGYHPLRDFAPVTALAAVPTVLVVHPSVPVANLQDFVRLAKSKPGEINYGSAGNGSIHHLTMAIFASRAGIDVKHIPYRGGTPLIAAVTSGEVHLGWSGIPNVQSPIQTGALKVLAISTSSRSQSMPNVPTAIEQGFADFDIATLIGMQVPTGTPPGIIRTLQAESAKALREPDVVARMATLGMLLRENGTEPYAKYLREDLDRYIAAVQIAGVKPE